MKLQVLILFCLVTILMGCKIKNMTIHHSDASYKEKSSSNLDEVSLDPIYFGNPSFEDDKCAHSTIPNKWTICRNRESPPDIQSNYQKYFKVSTNASEGQNFVGMVVRDNSTVEHIAQKLAVPLKTNTPYEFHVDLSISPELVSLSRSTLSEENFNEPTILRVWGSNDICTDYENEQLLYQTTRIDHYDWREYEIQFIPDNDYDYIILEAFYDEEMRMPPYNGNLMIDNLSPIRRMSE